MKSATGVKSLDSAPRVPPAAATEMVIAVGELINEPNLLVAVTVIVWLLTPSPTLG